MSASSVEFEALKERAAAAAEIMRLLGNANRLQLLCQIAQGERSVAQLEEQLDIRQPALSQQLAELRKAGLVRTRRESRSVLYSLDEKQALPLLEMLLVAFGLRKRPDIDVQDTPDAAPASRQIGDAARFARLIR